MSREEHLKASSGIVVRCAVITLSDTRNESTDKSGQAIKDLLVGAGNEVSRYHIIRDEPVELKKLLDELLSAATVDAILTNGGTGISRRDQTISVVEKNIERDLPGFGELFRMLSWEQVGSAAMLSRAIGGVSKGKLIFAMPGSTKAVELAMTRLILPELKHIIAELRK